MGTCVHNSIWGQAVPSSELTERRTTAGQGELDSVFTALMPVHYAKLRCKMTDKLGCTSFIFTRQGTWTALTEVFLINSLTIDEI